MRVAEWVMEFTAAHNPVGPDPRRHRVQTRRQHGGQPGPFTLFGNRSAATRAGASSGRQDNRLYLLPQEFSGNFSPDAAHGVEAA